MSLHGRKFYRDPLVVGKKVGYCLGIKWVFILHSRLPIYYRKLAGNLPDVKTVKKLLADMAFLDCSKVKLVMDREFYSEENIDALYKQHLKFLMSVRMSLNFVKAELENNRNNIRTWNCYSAERAAQN